MGGFEVGLRISLWVLPNLEGVWQPCGARTLFLQCCANVLLASAELVDCVVNDRSKRLPFVRGGEGKAVGETIQACRRRSDDQGSVRVKKALHTAAARGRTWRSCKAHSEPPNVHMLAKGAA